MPPPYKQPCPQELTLSFEKLEISHVLFSYKRIVGLSQNLGY